MKKTDDSSEAEEFLGEQEKTVTGKDIAASIFLGPLGGAARLYRKFKQRQKEKQMREGFEDSGLDGYEPL